jgi:hypothetical protein
MSSSFFPTRYSIPPPFPTTTLSFLLDSLVVVLLPLMLLLLLCSCALFFLLFSFVNGNPEGTNPASSAAQFKNSG